ncbi:MAG: flagellar motor protein [Bryobacteraceae bacterium]|jgi:chemotaxis protein MotA
MATAPQKVPVVSPQPIGVSPDAWSGLAARAPRRPDLSTLAGISLALAGLIGGLLLERGSIQDIAQTTAAMIVLGGTFGAVLVTTPLHLVLRALRRLGDVFFDSSPSHSEVIDHLIRCASRARREGIVSLESETESIPDPFLRKALSLAVDGTDLQELRKMMEIDIVQSEQAREAEAGVWEAAGGYAPTIGIIGAVMGLIQVMKHLENMKEVGHGIAVAFVATVYGVGSANIFFLPAANKLRAKLREAVALREMVLEGVAAIVEGLNPTLIRLKLESFDPRRDQSSTVAARTDQFPSPQPATPPKAVRRR